MGELWCSHALSPRLALDREGICNQTLSFKGPLAAAWLESPAPPESSEWLARAPAGSGKSVWTS
jgi:hypothetical protein